MNIVAIDFDDTISQNEAGWYRVMKLLEEIGYQVIIVTYRQPNCYPEDLEWFKQKGFKIIFTGQQSKREYTKDLGYDVAIWIDDMPESILYDYDIMRGKFMPVSEEQA